MTVSLVDESGGQDIGGSTGIKTFSFTVTAGADWIVVGITQHDDDNPPTLVKYNGVLLTKWAEAKTNSGGEKRASLWAGVKADIAIASGANDVSITLNAANIAKAFAWAGTTGGTAKVVDFDEDAAPSGPALATMDSVADLGMAIIATCDDCQSLEANTTEDFGVFDGNCHKYGHETTPTTGSRSRGWDGNTIHATAGLMIADTVLDFTPDPIGAVMGFKAVTVSIPADMTIIGAPPPGVVFGFNPVEISIEGPRNLSLVGEDPETPEMTDVPAIPASGPDVQLLRYRRGRKPAYEPLGDLVGETGAHGDKVFRYNSFK